MQAFILWVQWVQLPTSTHQFPIIFWNFSTLNGLWGGTLSKKSANTHPFWAPKIKACIVQYFDTVIFNCMYYVSKLKIYIKLTVSQNCFPYLIIQKLTVLKFGNFGYFIMAFKKQYLSTCHRLWTLLIRSSNSIRGPLTYVTFTTIYRLIYF